MPCGTGLWPCLAAFGWVLTLVIFDFGWLNGGSRLVSRSVNLTTFVCQVCTASAQLVTAFLTAASPHTIFPQVALNPLKSKYSAK